MHKLMNIATALALGATLAACSVGQSNGNASSSGSLIGNVVDHALDQAREKLTTENITVSEHGSDHDQHLPKAEITPKGDFLIDGKPVPLTAPQRQQVLAYRQQMIAIGEQGIAVGKQGAAIGMQVAGTAIAAALSGKSDQQIQQAAETKAAGIRQAAAKICDRLPSLMAAQQKLAAAVPAFKPYATMTQKDIDDCRAGALHDDD